MALLSLLNRIVQRITFSRGTINEYGEAIWNETTEETFSAAIQPIKGEEIREISGKVLTASHKLYCLNSVTISEGNKLTCEGKTYLVKWVSDDGGRSHHHKVLLEELV